MRKAYKCRAYPDDVQQAILNRTFGCIRVVWNTTLAERHRLWRTERRRLPNNFLTEIKRRPELVFLNEVSSVPLQQSLRHQDKAFSTFFAKRARYPRFKSRYSRQSAHYARSAFSMRGGVLRIAKTLAPLKFVWSWSNAELEDLDPTMVVVSRDTDGRWYVTFCVEVKTNEPLSKAEKAVGVDLGIKDFAVTSDAARIANPKLLARRARQLARYQRRLSRCQKGSANRIKAKAKVARAHRKVRQARQDFLHRTSTRLVRENDVIVIEDLAVKNMVRNRRLARAISDCGWGEFRRQLEYKCEWYGREFVVIDRFYPSSKTCSFCGHLLSQLSLGTRHWTCPDCGTRHDRDVNAAKNILAAGLAVSACGVDVRHNGTTRVQSAVKQESQALRLWG